MSDANHKANEIPGGGECSEPGCDCGSSRAEEVLELADLMTEEELAYFQNFNILVTDENKPIYWTT